MECNVRKSIVLILLVLLVFAGAASAKEPETGSDPAEKESSLGNVPEFMEELENAGFTCMRVRSNT